jgi:hypothetical protein
MPPALIPAQPPVIPLATRLLWMALGGALTLGCTIAVLGWREIPHEPPEGSRSPEEAVPIMTRHDREWCADPDHLCGDPEAVDPFTIDDSDIIQGSGPVCDCLIGGVAPDAIGEARPSSLDEDPCAHCDYMLDRHPTSPPPAAPPTPLPRSPRSSRSAPFSVPPP